MQSGPFALRFFSNPAKPYYFFSFYKILSFANNSEIIHKDDIRFLNLVKPVTNLKCR